MFSTARMITLSIALAVSGAGLASAQTMVKEIDVDVDLTAIANEAAASHFATIDSDLEAALLTRLADRIAEDGVTIGIDLSEVELSNFFEQEYDTAETRLVGQVNVTNATQNTDFSSYELAIRVNDLGALAGADARDLTLAQSSDEYYAMMIAAFADVVVQRLDE